MKIQLVGELSKGVIGEEEEIAGIAAKFLSRVEVEADVWRVDASGVHYRDLNGLLRKLNDNGARKIELHGVHGQRYIGTDLQKEVEIDVYGTPGNDLGAFMDGPRLVIHGNAQDGCGNTMNDGRIIVHGHAGDITGYSMRGGRIFVRDDVGYRAGIHMKEYIGRRPFLVVGGTAQDFLGEYMAGGVLVVLGLNLKSETQHTARFVGTGMHGGTVYIRGRVAHLANDVEIADIQDDDRRLLRSLAYEFCRYFKFDAEEILGDRFCKIIPVSNRPYGKLYAY